MCPFRKLLQVYFSEKQSLFFLFMSVCVSVSISTSKRRPAIPGAVKSYLWGFFIIVQKRAKKVPAPARHHTDSNVGGNPMFQGPFSRSVTCNLPLARLSDSSSLSQVQANFSQGHVRPSSVLIPLSALLHSFPVKKGWEGFLTEYP